MQNWSTYSSGDRRGPHSSFPKSTVPTAVFGPPSHSTLSSFVDPKVPLVFCFFAKRSGLQYGDSETMGTLSPPNVGVWKDAPLETLPSKCDKGSKTSIVSDAWAEVLMGVIVPTGGWDCILLGGWADAMPIGLGPALPIVLEPFSNGGHKDLYNSNCSRTRPRINRRNRLGSRIFFGRVPDMFARKRLQWRVGVFDEIAPASYRPPQPSIWSRPPPIPHAHFLPDRDRDRIRIGASIGRRLRDRRDNRSR